MRCNKFRFRSGKLSRTREKYGPIRAATHLFPGGRTVRSGKASSSGQRSGEPGGVEKPGAIAIFIPPATLAARPGRPQVRPRPKSITMIYRSKAPLRIGLAGGGTDVSPYSDLYGGAILNATVSLYAHATIEPTDEPQIVLRALDRNQTLRYELQSELPIDGVLDLHKGIYNHVVSQFGPIESGFSLNTFVDAPAGSGLGSSSTLVVAILGAFAQWLRLPLGSYDVAQRAYRIERDELGMAGGKQDQYAATFGGFNYMEFYDDRVIVNPLRIKREYINELENNLLLYYTSKSRVSAEIIEQQQQNVLSDNRSSVEAMHVIKQQAAQMKEALLTGRLNRIGELLHEGFVYKKRLASAISNPLIDEIYDTALRAGAIGGKILGAGGGGFMAFYCPDVKRYDVMDRLKHFGGVFHSYDFVEEGLCTWSL